MVIGGIVAFVWGVNAERRSLEHVTVPLSAVMVPAVGAAASGLTGGLTSHVRRTPQNEYDEYLRT
jgi:hypothetical protein